MKTLEFYRGKKVLVTGHTGFKGSWLSQWLIELGADVAGYSIGIPDQPAQKERSHFEILGLEKSLRHQLGDIRDLSQMKAFFRDFQPEIVFHLAAQPLVRASYDDPKESFDTNVGGTVNVLECIRSVSSVKAAVLIATDKCYENVERAEGYLETDRLGGKDPYSASKAAAEIVFHSYQESFFSAPHAPAVASARAGNVIGGGDWAIDRLIPDCVRAWSKSQAVTIRNPESIRPWQHVMEPLWAYLVLGQELFQRNPSVVGQSFNFGPPEASAQTVANVLQELSRDWKLSQAKVVVEPQVGTQKKESGILKLNCDKAAKILKWNAKLNFEDTLQLTAKWYETYFSGKENMRNYTVLQLREYSRNLT